MQSDNLFQYIELFEQTYNYNNERGNSLGACAVLVAAYHISYENVITHIAGFLRAEHDDVNNAWDLVRKIAENNCVRYHFDYSQYKFIVDPIFDASKTININKAIDGSLKLELHSKNISKAIAHTKNNDVKSYEYSYTGSLNDASEETSALLCNISIYTDDEIKKTDNTYQCNTQGVPSHLMFYGDANIKAMVKVHYSNIFKLDKNGNIVINQNTIIPFPDAVTSVGGKVRIDKYFHGKYLDYIRKTTEYSYIGTISKLYLMVFGNLNNAMVEFETDEITANDIGAWVNIDLQALLKTNLFNGRINNKGVIVNVEQDLISGKSKCKTFLFTL